MAERRLLALVFGAGLALAASCGASDDDRSSATSTTADSTTTTTARAATTTEPAVEGATGVGDPYYPGLGNAGYDVVSYDLAIDVDPTGPGTLRGVATIVARASERLSAFHLDLTGLEVQDVTVDGEPAIFSRAGAELQVQPPNPIERDAELTVAVTYGGTPVPLDSGVELLPDVGWFDLPGDAGSYVLSEPSGASTWFPSNDHPGDKATYTFRITVPEGMEAAANGLLESSTTAGGRTTWTWRMGDPMATYLAIVVVGQLTFEDAGTSASGVPVRNVYSDAVAVPASATFQPQAEMIDLFASLFGPYPFDAYGAVVVDADLSVALETQSLSLFGRDIIPGGEIVVAHELAHQWFGDAVTPSSWQDIWLNEGFATYAQWLWADHRGMAALAAQVREAHNRMERTGLGDVPPGDPGAGDLFHPSVYERGALALHALRGAIGDPAFFTTLQRWVAEHSGANASTADLEALAEQVSGTDLGPLFEDWLYSPELPPLPG